MAQRSSPGRRIPGDPLAGILRTVAFQARYSNRRRGDVPTVTSAVGQAASAEAAAGVSSMVLQSFALTATPETEDAAMARAATQPDQAELLTATDVATQPEPYELPRNDAATFMVDENGSATWQYEDRGTVPHVVATAVADQPAVATISDRTATSVTVHVWDLTGQPVIGGTVSVAALWP